MGKFEVMDHPLIQHKLTMIRDKNVGNLNPDGVRGGTGYAAQRR